MSDDAALRRACDIVMAQLWHALAYEPKTLEQWQEQGSKELLAFAMAQRRAGLLEAAHKVDVFPAGEAESSGDALNRFARHLRAEAKKE